MGVKRKAQTRMIHSNIRSLFGRRVRELRRRSNLSQEEFAHVVGLDRSYVGGVERCERNISLENIWLICQGLGLPLSTLFDFDVPQPTKAGNGKQRK